MRRWIKRFACVAILLLVVALAMVMFGGFRLKDPQGNVAFGWDSGERRFLFMESRGLVRRGRTPSWVATDTKCFRRCVAAMTSVLPASTCRRRPCRS